MTTFGLLKEGDKFIALPSEHDRENVRGPYFIFQKMRVHHAGGLPSNAFRIHDGIYSNMPDEMQVLEVK